MQDYLFLTISSFAQLFLISFVIWMGLLMVLMIREMFSTEELVIRKYLLKAWIMLLLSIELVAYISVPAYLIMLLITDKYVEYGISALVAISLSTTYLYLRRSIGGFKRKAK